MRPILSKTAAFLKPKRRWFQFSLRTLFIVMTVFAVWLGWAIKRACDQEAAVAAIQKAGGLVTYEKPPGPQWLHRLVGRDFLADVVSITADAPEVGGAARISDAEMVHFAALRHLQCLNLEGQAQVTDLAHLARLKGLETLYLHGTQVTDAGMSHLSRLRNLQALDLSYTKVGDPGLANLKDLKSLRDLFLNGTQITDAGLTHLQKLTQLEQLGLCKTKVTDAGLPHLAGLTTLKVLELRKTQVTAEGIRKLQNSLPNCTIDARLEVGRQGLGRPLASEGQTKGD